MYNNNIFNIDFKRWVYWLMPSFMRKPTFYAMLLALISPIEALYNKFIVNRATNLYKLNHNSQVFSMQNVLNDRFDNTLRRIYITDGLTRDRLYLYTRPENKPLYLQVYLYNSSDYADTGIDFIVWVPGGVNLNDTDKTEMAALIKFYKLAGKRFIIYAI